MIFLAAAGGWADGLSMYISTKCNTVREHGTNFICEMLPDLHFELGRYLGWTFWDA